MVLPLIPIAIGLSGIGAGAALHHWLTADPIDVWADRDTFNARMRDMHSLALGLNEGFAHCKAFTSDAAQLAAWRGARDGFGKFYGDTGTLSYSSPSTAQISTAKSYASKFYFWTNEYNRLKCGGAISPTEPSGGKLYEEPAPPPTQDWATIVKWSAIGLGGAFLVKTVSDLFKRS